MGEKRYIKYTAVFQLVAPCVTPQEVSEKCRRIEKDVSYLRLVRLVIQLPDGGEILSGNPTKEEK